VRTKDEIARADTPTCEACGHPQRALSENVNWTHAYNLHDENAALRADIRRLDTLRFDLEQQLHVVVTERDSARAERDEARKALQSLYDEAMETEDYEQAWGFVKNLRADGDTVAKLLGMNQKDWLDRAEARRVLERTEEGK
jgi:hypothetical protein